MISCSTTQTHTHTHAPSLFLTYPFPISLSTLPADKLESALLKYVNQSVNQYDQFLGRYTDLQLRLNDTFPLVWLLFSSSHNLPPLTRLPAPEPVWTACSDPGEGRLVSGCSHCSSPQQPTPQHHRRRAQKLTHALYTTHIPIPHGKDGQRRK